MSSRETRELSIVTGRHPFFEELFAVPVLDDDLRLRFITDYVPTNRAFRPMVRELSFDICELALATYVQARAMGVPITLLPVTVLSRVQHGLLVQDSCRRTLVPKDLEGRQVGVRAYSQTTGVWIRSILRSQFGVDCRGIEWIVSEESHVAGVIDPPNVTRCTHCLSPREALRSGEIDAYIGELASDGDLTPVIPDPVGSARDWFASGRSVPVNHVLVVKEELLRERADDVRIAYLRLAAAAAEWKTSAPRDAALPHVDFFPTGFAALAPVLEQISLEAFTQSLASSHLTIADLVHPFSTELS